MFFRDYHDKLIEIIKKSFPEKSGREHEETFKDLNALAKIVIPSKVTIEPIDDGEADKCQLYLYLIICKLGMISLTSEDTEQDFCVFPCLLRTIGNTLYSILVLSKNGLDFQAQILQRNLMEQYALLISITTDSKKREAYIKNNLGKQATKSWHENFTMKKTKELLRTYWKSDKNLIEDLITWYENFTREYSGFVHNDYANVVCYSYASFKPNLTARNYCGEHITRYNQTVSNSFKTVFVMILLFDFVLFDKTVDVNCNDLIREQETLNAYKRFSKVINDLGFEIFKNISIKEKRSKSVQL